MFKTNLLPFAWGRWLSLSGLMLAITAPSGHAFNILLPTIHEDITTAAATAAGWNRAAIDQLVANVRLVDLLDVQRTCPNGTGYFAINTNVQPLMPSYMAAHHFDRNPGVSNAVAFTNGAAYVQAALAAAVAAAVATNGTNARLSAAQGIHALEDLFAHSNFLDLNAADQATVTNAIYRASAAPPATLQLTGYNNAPASACENCGLPAGDPRPHQDWALDTATYNAYASAMIVVNGATNTRHFFAMTQAITSGTDFLNRIATAAGNATNVIQTADASQPGADEAGYQWAALQAYDTNGFTASYQSPEEGLNYVVFPSISLPQPERAGILGDNISTLNHAEDNVWTYTGQAVTIFREIRPTYQYFSTPLQVHFQYSSSEAAPFVPGTVGVFYAPDNGTNWQQVPAVISESQQTADFSANYGGLYAIGGAISPEFASISHPSAGLVNLYISSAPGANITLQTSFNLTNWFNLNTFTNTTGIFEYTDPIAPQPPQKFYRLLIP